MKYLHTAGFALFSGVILILILLYRFGNLSPAVTPTREYTPQTVTYTSAPAIAVNKLPVITGNTIPRNDRPTEENAAVVPEENQTVEPEWICLGEFKITFYTPYCDGGRWGYRTATGVRSQHLATCAVDKKVIPLGSIISVNGLELRCVDVGSAVKGNIIDIFLDTTVSEAKKWIKEFGTKHEVMIKET